MAKRSRAQRLLRIALSLQLLALLIGFVILYTCTSGGIPTHDLSETLFWGTIGIVRFMFLGIIFPLTFVVGLVISVLLVCGATWKRFSFLSSIAFLIWSVYWILVSYTLCAPEPD